MSSIWRAIRLEREAWLRFFGALGGLALAFLAAIYSTAARESGNLLATIVLASLALLLAGAVGLVTVPYLARRIALGRMREAIDYDLTREGLMYLGMALVIGVAALNTGNNLLFLVVAAMLGAVVISGIASVAVLRGLDLEFVLPEHVFAETASSVRVKLHNQRRVLPSFSIAVTPPRQRNRRWRAQRTTFSFPWWSSPERRWLRVADWAVRLEPKPAAADAILAKSVYFPYVPARSVVAAEQQLRFARRGCYTQESFGLATRFPFSFLKKTRTISLARELIVYPPVEPTDSSLAVLPMITGEYETFVRGRGYDLYRIRDYQPEDPRKHVDWKATAKTGELKVREFTREDERKLRIVFDNPGPGVLSDEEYENAVRLLASLVWHFAGENTQLSFAAPGYDHGGNVYDILHYLALVQPEESPSILDKLSVTDDYNLVVTARPRGSIPIALWACSYVLFVDGTLPAGT